VSKSTESPIEPPAVTGSSDDAGHHELAIFSPLLPPARFVELDDRGTVMVRDFGGAPGAPVIALLHGWTATADLNWFRTYGALGERYRVIAFDHRGHGTGLRPKKPFRLEDCADDVVAMADALDLEKIVPVGYSMGGPIAQLIWRRHPERVSGMVLCATAPYFAGRREKRLGAVGFGGLAAVARLAPEQTKTWLVEQLYLQRRTAKWEPWALRETADHDWRAVIEAGKELGKFSSTDWIGQVDVPVSSVFTMRDQVVPLRRQVKLFEAIPDSEAFRVDGLHDAVVANADRFTPTLIRAIESVLRRS
jgi:3-oxoadipate enol-lactonase